MTDAPAGSPRSHRLIDEATGQQVQLVYAIPPELLAGGEAAKDEVRLGDLAARLWRRRKGMALIAGGAVVVAIVLALVMRPTWTATVTAIPPAARSGALAGLGQYADLASLAGVSLPSGGGSAVEEIMAILNSRTLHAKLIEEYGLIAHYRAELLADALKSFDADFNPAFDKKANTITFALTTFIGTEQIPDQAKLAEIVNRAAVETQAIFNRIHQSSSGRERAFLEGRLTLVDGELAAAQHAMAEFQREHRTIEIESQVKATVEAISALQGQMIGQQVELRALLASSASADNPSIQLLQERIRGLDEVIAQLTGSDPSKAGGEGNVLLQLGTLPEIGIRYVNLYREVKKNEAIVQALTAQVEAARFAELRSAEVISIIDPAIAPQRRTAPKRSMMVVLGGLLGCMATVAWALAADPLGAWWRELRSKPGIAA